MDQFFTVLKVHDYRVCNIDKCDSHTPTLIIKGKKKERRNVGRKKEKKKDNTLSQMSTCRRIPPYSMFNPLMPNDPYRGHTAPLTSKHCILYIYSTNTGTEYFKHGIYSPFFPLQNAVCFINLMYLVPVLFTFYIEGVLKLKK